MYMAISGGESGASAIDQIVKPELQEEYHNGGKAEFLSTLKYHNRTPGLFKAELQETRMIALMSKCYYVDVGGVSTVTGWKPKFIFKDVSKKQNPMGWERYLKAQWKYRQSE